MALPATDAFTGTNGASLAARAGWSVNNGAFQINTNSLCANSAANECGGRWTSDTFANDQYAQGVITANSGSGTVGPAVRISTSGAASYYGYYTDNGVSQLFKMVAGTWTQFGSNLASVVVGHTMRLEVTGTGLTATNNGTTVATATDSTHASGAAGVTGFGASTTVRLDDWEGGNIGVAAAVSTQSPFFVNPMRPTATRVIGRTALAMRAIRPPASGAPAVYTATLATGSYSLTGQPVGLVASRRIAVANGSYALTGQDVGLHRALVMPAAAGAYTLTGQSVALRASRRIAVANGTYALNGQAVVLRAGRTISLANGSYALSGQAVRLAAARRLALSNGVYSLTGEPVTLTKVGATGTTTLIAGLGSYVLTGEPVTLRALRRMAVAAGIFTLTGIDVRLGVAHLDDVGTILPSRGIVERRFGAIRTRNRPGSVLVDRSPTTGQDVVGDSWIPDDSSGAGLSLSVIAEACRLVRAGGLVYAFFAIVLPATVNTAPAAISLPVIARDTFVPVAPVTWSYITIADVTGVVVNGATQFNLYHTDGSPVTNAQLSGKVLRGCAIYEAAS